VELIDDFLWIFRGKTNQLFFRGVVTLLKRLIGATDMLNGENVLQTYDFIFRDWEEGTNTRWGWKKTLSSYRLVFTAESLTTPVRNVFDASCPQLLPGKGTKSTGTDPFNLRRFRQKPIVVVADIRKALKTIGVMDEFPKIPMVGAQAAEDI
jgi:hypothetical protein